MHMYVYDACEIWADKRILKSGEFFFPLARLRRTLLFFSQSTRKRLRTSNGGEKMESLHPRKFAHGFLGASLRTTVGGGGT